MEEAAMDIFIPVYESAIVLAGFYAKNCGRTSVTAEDLQYGWRFAARNVVGKQIGSLYPEVYDEESTDEDEEWEEVDEAEEPFTRYEGTDETCVKMNECYDTWDEWVPESPVEEALKKSIDKAGNVQT
jgi:hypothetical protein